jgi:DNA helicase-2/ATP-dependent DNA helicase PcrA
MTSRASQPDVEADKELRACLDETPRRSFIMLAGAGSGKTTSLVKALDHVVRLRGRELRQLGQKIACITYTEIAVQEIESDVGNTDIVHISTIHSFLWTLVKPFQADLRRWADERLLEKISEAEVRIAKPGTQGKTKIKLAAAIERYREHRFALSSVQSFGYGTGSDYSKGVFGHDDILKIGTSFLLNKPLLRKVIAKGYPVIFVDESQDTYPAVVDALKAVERDATGAMSLGFFGDQMQKIYTTGLGKVESVEGWRSITKPENFRCPTDVLSVVNAVRAEDDGLVQTGGRTRLEGADRVPVKGSAQIFVLPTDGRAESDRRVRAWLAERHGDPLWQSDEEDGDVRILVLVHRMAAIRLGFPNVYAALNDNGSHAVKDSLLDGSSWVLRPFISTILPLVRHVLAGSTFETVRLLRLASPRLANGTLTAANAKATLDSLKKAMNALAVLWDEGSQSTVRDTLQLVADQGICELDECFADYLGRDPTATASEDDPPDAAAALAFLRCPARELMAYQRYIEDRSPFKTQQGTKGAEFERVLVLMDDEEAGYSLFSTGKYFGYAPLSPKDEENIAAGEDSVVGRTRRLFYVCCSRAEKDLAVMLFAQDVEAARAAVLAKGFFTTDSVFGLADLPA